jgi:uncharacterized protein
MRSASLALVAALLAAALPARARAEAGHEAALLAWRAERERRLRAADGWLTVAGLFWLKEGTNRIGTAPGSEVLLPAGAAPPLVGTIDRRGARLALAVTPGVTVLAGGAPVSASELRAGDALTVGRLTLIVLERGGRLGLRLRDPEHPARKAWKGLTWFPVAPRLRLVARFAPHPDRRTLPVPNVLGDLVPMANPGRVLFDLGGRTHALEAVLEAPGATELLLVFADGTTGKTTYPGGRFLYTELPVNGRVVLDFNRAESPPCAYTAFATCPLPPRQNRLEVPITAGETYAGDAHD